MELDFNLMVISSLVVVIVMLLVYIAWRFREQKVSLSALNLEDLFSRVKDGEMLLQKVREQPCWNCVPAGTIVSGANSQIELLKPGDYILGGGGYEQKILETFEREYAGDFTEIRAMGSLPISFTSEHPVLVVKRLMCSSTVFCRKFMTEPCTWGRFHCKKYDEWEWRPKWIKAKDVEKGDYVLIPRVKVTESAYLPVAKMPCSFFPFRKMSSSVKISPKFAWLLGLYLAEGCTSIGRRQNVVKFSFGKHEGELIRRVRECLKSLGFHPNIREAKTSIVVSFSDKYLAPFLKKSFGERARNKCIPEFIKKLPRHHLISFLDGYIAGDGYINRGQYVITTSSKKIVSDIVEVLAKIGICPSVAIVKEGDRLILGRLVKRSGCYRISIHAGKWGEHIKQQPKQARKVRTFITDENYIYAPVKSVRKYTNNCVVHNIRTEDNTYALPFIVHNCGSNEKDVAGNLFEDNEITFTCKGCGTQTIWKRGKQWVIETGTVGYLEKLGKKVDVEKRKLGIKEK
jgi:hypothetical protein